MELATLLLYIIIAVASLSVYLVKRNLGYWKRQGIPHEEPHLIMGNFKGLRTIANYYYKFKGTGPFAGTHLVERPAVVLLNKALIKNVLIKIF